MARNYSLSLSFLAIIFSAASRSVHAQPAPNYPTTDPLTHKSYTESIQRDGTKSSFDMIAIPGGTFLMGSPATEKGRKEHEGPQHPVTIKPLWVGKCEVTWGEYDLFWEKQANEKPPMSGADKKADAVTRPSKANHHDID